MARYERYPISEGKADPDVLRKTEGSTLIDTARRLVERLSKRPVKEPKRTDNPRISKDVRETINSRLGLKELRNQIKEAHRNKMPSEFIPISETTKKQLTDKLKKAGKESTAARIVNRVEISDERSAQQALELLNTIQETDTKKLANQIRQEAENLWRLQVGSGQDNQGSVEARKMLWELEKSLTSKVGDQNGFKQLNDLERNELRIDLGLMLQTSIQTPELSNPLDAGDFQDRANQIVRKINERYVDYESSDDIVEFRSGDRLNSSNIHQDILDVTEDWNDYVQEYKINHDGQEPPDSEKRAYEHIRQQLLDLQENYYQINNDQNNRTTQEDLLRQRLNPEEGREYRDRIPNKFQASNKEIKELLRQPIAALEKKITSMESRVLLGGLEDKSLQSEFERYQLMLDFFLSGEYDETNFIERLQDPNDPEAKQLFLQFKDSLTPQKQILLKELAARFKAIQILPAFSNAKGFSDQNFVQTVSGLSENFFIEYPTAAGGLTEDADDILTAKTMRLLRNEHGKSSRLTRDVMAKAIEDTRMEMLRKVRTADGNEVEVYRKQYEDYLSGIYYQTEAGNIDLQNPMEPTTDQENLIITYEEYINAVVNRAVINKYISLNWGELEMRGLDPYADQQFGSGLGIYEEPRHMLSALKARREFDVRQWQGIEGTKALVVAHNRETALFYANHYHEVDHEAEHEMEHFMQLMNSDISQEDKIKRLEYLYFWNPDSHAEGWSEEDYKIKLDQIRSGQLKRELLQEFKVQIGIQIADTHGLQGYTLTESGWRNQQEFNAINKTWSTIFGSEIPHSMFTSRRLIDVSRTYAMKKLHHKHGAEKAFHEGLIDVAKYRPHNMAELMLEMSDDVFLEWFEHAGIGHDPNEILSQMNEMVSKTNRGLFRGLMEAPTKDSAAQYVPINFSQRRNSWTQAQRSVFDSVLTTFGLSTEQQFEEQAERFRKLYEFIISQQSLNRFSSVRYERLLAYSGQKWKDDEPMIIAQHPGRIRFLDEETRKSVRSLGSVLSGDGLQESKGTRKRMFGENAGLEQMSAYYKKIFKASEQEMLKMLTEMHSVASTTIGNESAAIMQEEEQYTWIKMRQLYPLKGANWYDATPYRKYSGDQKADIVYPEEAHHIQGKAFSLMSNSNEFISSLMHTKEQKLRMASWDKWLGGHEGVVSQLMKKLYGDRLGEIRYSQFLHFMNDRYPNLILKDKLVKLGGYAFLVTAIFLFYKVAESFSEEVNIVPPTGGGHSGGHGGGHH